MHCSVPPAAAPSTVGGCASCGAAAGARQSILRELRDCSARLSHPGIKRPRAVTSRAEHSIS